MNNLWDQTIIIDQDLAYKLITSQFKIPIQEIKKTGEGFDNIAYLVNERIIFRFPRREVGTLLIQKEIALLPYLAQQLPFSISSPEYIGRPTTEYPYNFMGYFMIKGKTLCKACKPPIDNIVFARTLGNWLKCLHSISVDPDHYLIMKQAGKLDRLNIPHYINLLNKYLVKYENHYLTSGMNLRKIKEIIDSFNYLNFKLSSVCYIHGDLYSRHIVTDGERPLGLIDWGDMDINHPGIDLAICALFNEKALEEFIKSYGDISSDTMKIAIFRAFCHSMMCLPYASEQNDPEFKEWTITMLKQATLKFPLDG